jgi:radical SAM superfamily enzyme YgiQ (UPF0313 family)
MKVLLINISLRPESPKIFPPVGLAYIATAIHKAGFELAILDNDVHRYTDQQFERLLGEKEYDVVAFGCIVTGYKIVKHLAGIIKKQKNVPIIAGNSVATSIPDTLLQKTDVDIAVMGEGDITIVELLKAIENDLPLETIQGICFKQGGKIVKNPMRPPVKNLDDLPLIDWDLFDMEYYISKSKKGVGEPYPIEYDSIKLMPLNTARGCPYNCTFCYHVFRNPRYRRRSTQSVVDEIKLLKKKYGVNYISFWDELTFYSRKQSEEFVDALIREDLQIYWSGTCRSDLFTKDDIEIARKFKKAGCVSLGGALESANTEILKAMNKRLTLDQFKEHVKTVQAAGVPTTTSVVIGYPQETKETLQETFDCCYEANVYPSVGYLLPQPGSPIYADLISQGVIKDEEEYILSMGDRQDFTINLTKMEQKEMEDLVKMHMRRLSDKLNLGLSDEKLIKTGRYKATVEQKTGGRNE